MIHRTHGKDVCDAREQNVTLAQSVIKKQSKLGAHAIGHKKTIKTRYSGSDI
jgi:hypothetical protein